MPASFLGSAHPEPTVPSVAQDLGGLRLKWMGRHPHFTTSAPPTALLSQLLCPPGTPPPTRHWVGV